MSSPWCALKPFKYEFFPSPIKLNDNQFALVPSKWSSNSDRSADGIYVYDLSINDWNKIIDYPKDITSNSQTALYHKERNSIYVLNAQNGLLQFNLTTKEMKILDKNVQGFDSYPGLVLVGDEIHMFAAYNLKHAIYNCSNDTITHQTLPIEIGRFFSKSTLYLQTRNIILIFASDLQKIYEHSLLNHKWSIRDVKIPNNSAAICATSDEKYIIIAAMRYLYMILIKMYFQKVKCKERNMVHMDHVDQLL